MGVLVLVVLAGCQFAAQTSTPRPTLSPAPVPTATATATPDTAAALPPGVDRTGIADLNALIEAHVAAARESRWVWQERRVRHQDYGNASSAVIRSQNVTYADESTYRRRANVLSDRFGQRVRYYHDFDAYADGRVAYATWVSSFTDETEYRRDPTSTVGRNFVGFATDPIRKHLLLDSMRVSRVDVGSRQHFAIVGTRSSVAYSGAVSNFTARAVVREDGFVRSLNVSYVVDRRNRQVETTYNFSYRRFGSATVDRPDWVGTARNRTGGP